MRRLALLILLGCNAPMPEVPVRAAEPTPVDRDGDGVTADRDCDDSDALIGPGMPEICGNRDEDCDGLVDEDDPDLVGALHGYEDGDGDGWGDAPTVSCGHRSGFVDDGGDCDDTDPTRHPATAWFVDGDADGFGTGTSLASCEDVAGRVVEQGDCDDGDGTMHPGAEDVCGDGQDANCDRVDACAVDLIGEATSHIVSRSPRPAELRLRPLGDLVGSDAADLLVVEREPDGETRSWIFEGPLPSTVELLDADALEAAAWETVGDHDADGLVDVAWVEEGGVRLVAGANLASAPMTLIEGLAASEHADGGVALVLAVEPGARPMLGDAPEIVLAAAWVERCLGPAALVLADPLHGGAVDSACGDPGAVGGDMDGDGLGELVAWQARTSEVDEGWRWYGGEDLADRVDLEGRAADRVAFVGDLDGDGYGELLLGYAVYHGGSTGPRATLASLEPPLHGALLDVRGAGDVDGDGRGDLRVLAYSDSTGHRVDLLPGGFAGSVDLTGASAAWIAPEGSIELVPLDGGVGDWAVLARGSTELGLWILAD